MQKRTKNIHLLFIWLTGLMFFAHGITPHHHHFDSAFEHSQQTDTTDEHHEDNPAHCHAFNDLLVDKTDLISNLTFSPGLSAVVVEYFSCLQMIENSVVGINNSSQDETPPEEILLKNTPTRGSPSLV